jgi:hypothetical protein
MEWFVTSLVIGFLNCNNHLQLFVTQCIFMNVSIIGQVIWVVMNVIHHMWNNIHMQLIQLNYNHVETIIVQL